MGNRVFAGPIISPVVGFAVNRFVSATPVAETASRTPTWPQNSTRPKPQFSSRLRRQPLGNAWLVLVFTSLISIDSSLNYGSKLGLTSLRNRQYRPLFQYLRSPDHFWCCYFPGL